MSFTNARHIVRSAATLLHAPATRVFPLLCPVREYDWIPEWRCEMIHSSTGVIGPDCVFRTQFPGQDTPEIWVVSTHDPEHFRLGFVRVIPETCVTRMDIRLEPLGSPEQDETRLTCVKALTCLGPSGEAVLDAHTEAFHAKWLDGLTTRLDHYLATGTMWRPADVPR